MRWGPSRPWLSTGPHLRTASRATARPVVFVHGSADDLRSWEQQLPAIGASYRAIAYSRRYARPNQDIEPDADDQMLPHVDDLVAFLGVTGAAPAHLVGHSLGAFICLLTAIRHPQARAHPRAPGAAGAVAVHEHDAAPDGAAPTLGRRPRTALTIISFAAKTAVPAQKAFRRGDDDAAMQKFACGLLGKDTYERLPQERKQQARENLSTAASAGARCRLPATAAMTTCAVSGSRPCS